VPRLGNLYPLFEPKIRRLPKRRAVGERDLITPAFRLGPPGRLEIYYAPMDWLRPSARVAIVGITPGLGTMQIAYQTTLDGLAAGRGPAAVLNEVKARASFSGFRVQLASWLDWLGFPEHLGLSGSIQLWDRSGQQLLHPTSAVRYPVFVKGKDYGGRSPGLMKHPILRGVCIRCSWPRIGADP
jgi:hypothetical protein